MNLANVTGQTGESIISPVFPFDWTDDCGTRFLGVRNAEISARQHGSGQLVEFGNQSTLCERRREKLHHTIASDHPPKYPFFFFFLFFCSRNIMLSRDGIFRKAPVELRVGCIQANFLADKRAK